MKNIKKIILAIFISTLFIFTNIIHVNAASANISVSSSTSKVVVGNTFTVTIKISSSANLGAWEFTPSYNTKLFKMTSGESPVVAYADGAGVKSKTYTYKFKAIAKGSGSITVKSVGILDWETKSNMSVSKGSKNITVITQADLEASYSKNNYLKSLSVTGYDLSPAFNKNTTEYKVNVDSNTEQVTINATKEDSRASISGTGTHDVSEGENKFNITVTAENGSTKTYKVIVNVVDPNPIKATINDKEYTIVKRESTLETPDGFEKTKIKINEQEVPAFYNELNNFTLVALKDSEGEINYFLYDTEKRTYSTYAETTLATFKIYPLAIDKTFDESYTKTTVKINEIDFEAMNQSGSNFYVIHAKNLLTGKNGYYKYDKTLNSIITFSEDGLQPLKKEIEKYKTLIVVLGAETIFVILVLIIVLINTIIKRNKRKKLAKEQLRLKIELEEKKKQELEEKKKKELEELKQEEPKVKKTKKTKKSKEDKE